MIQLKRIIAGVMLWGGFLAMGCSEYKSKPEVTKEVKTAEVNKEAEVRSEMEKQFAQTLAEIDANLEMIKEREGVIQIGVGSPMEQNISQKEKIVRNIQFVNSLIKENKDKIAALNKQLKNSRFKNEKLEKLTASLQTRLNEYDVEMQNMKSQLAAYEVKEEEMNKRLDEADIKNQMLQSLADKYENDINTVYFTAGSYKELKEEGVIEKEGGFLGMGRKKIMKTDFEKSGEHFTKIDKRMNTSIPVFARKVELITPHPADAYELKMEGDIIASLEITNPEEFWKTSNFMVLEIDQ